MSGNAHMIHEWMHMKGFFSIKIALLGANKVLMEKMEEGIILSLITDAGDWVHEIFEDIRGWSLREVDNERGVWVRCHGIPAHVWNDEFFSALAPEFGAFLGDDENTSKKTSMDVARILIRTQSYDVFNMVVYANINDQVFHIKIFEEWCGPMHWNGQTQANHERHSKMMESELESGDDDGLPLFMAEGKDEW